MSFAASGNEGTVAYVCHIIPSNNSAIAVLQA